MLVGLERRDASARGATDEALLQQIRLDDLLQRIARLGERSGKGLDTNRPTVVGLGDAAEIAAVEAIETFGVDLKRGQRLVGERRVNDRGTAHRGEVAHAAEQAPGDARRAARAACDLVGAVLTDGSAEHARAARDDALKLLDVVEVEADRDAKTVAQRRRQQA